MRLVIAAMLVLVSATATAFADVGVNLYGFSYHEDRDIDFDEFNPGVGLRYRHRTPNWDYIGEVGYYRNSLSTETVYAAGGALWRVVDNVGVGLALVGMNSESYNKGDAFITPLPIVAVDVWKVTLNMTYFPKVEGYNEYPAFGFWATIWLK